MLQAHSFLWHYLWLAPHVLQLALAIVLCRRGLHKLFPVFLAYSIFEAIEEFALYGMDVLPSVSGETFWRAFCVGLAIEGLIKFTLILGVPVLFWCCSRPWQLHMLPSIIRKMR